MMQDEQKTKAELLQELDTLRRHICELEQTRKKAEQELKQYQFIVESAHDAVFFKDLKSRYIVANNKVLEAFALPREKVIGNNDYQIMPNKDEARRNIEDDNIVFKTGKPTEITKRMTDAEGKQRWFHGIKVPQFDDHGKIIGLVGIARDITERKKAENALRESEEKWRCLVENAPCVILTVKPDGTILFLNRTVPPFTPEKAAGTSVYDYVPPEYQQIMRDAFEQAVRTGEPCSYEVAGAGPDGCTSWYQSRLGPIKKDGRVVALTLIATDVTEHKQAEFELRQSEHKYRTLLENLPQKIFLKDISSVYLSCNENLAKDFKIKAEEIVGKTDYDLLPKELAEKYRADDKRIMESGQTQDIEERYIQDGQEVIIHTVKTPVKDEQGNVIGVLGIFWDITERKKAEEALRKEKDKAQKYLDIAGVMFLVVNANGTVELINRRGCEILGYSEDEIIGKNWFDTFIAQPIREEVRGIFRKLMAGKVEPVEYYENPVITKSGEERLIAWHNTILKDEHGNIIGSLSSAVDITESKKAEEALKESRERLGLALAAANMGTWRWNIKTDQDTRDASTQSTLDCRV